MKNIRTAQLPHHGKRNYEENCEYLPIIAGGMLCNVNRHQRR